MSKRRAPTSTDAVHAGTPRERPSHALTPAVHQTATYRFRDTADLERYFAGADPDPDRQEYGRYGNPTVREVENRVGALDRGEDALLFASGMAALSTAILAFVKAGDHVVLFRDVYRRTRQLVGTTLARLGVEHTMVDPCDLDAMEQAFSPRTRLVITESPTNPYLRCVDLAELAQRCKKRRIKSLVDATFATPINCRPLELGIDLVAHSATKYLAGHHDVLGGSLSGKASLISLVRELRDVLGPVMDPHAAALVGRGIKTLALRVAQQNQSALTIAEALQTHPAISSVHYPGLPNHPDYEVAQRQMTGFGGVVSFTVVGGLAAASRFCDRCQLAILAPSLGGVETLVEQPAVISFHELNDEQLAEVGIEPGLIRLAVGVEEATDILADLQQALSS